MDISVVEWARRTLDDDLPPDSRWGQLVGALADCIEALDSENERLEDAILDPFTDEEDEQIKQLATRSLRELSGRARGQTVHPSDHLDWHTARAAKEIIRRRGARTGEGE